MNLKRVIIIAALALMCLGATPVNYTAAPQDPLCEELAGVDKVKCDVHHEIGHVKYNKLTPEQLIAWKAIWSASIEAGLQPCQHYDIGGGKNGNYYEKNEIEGFCVAYSYAQLDVPLDSTIQTFFDNL